MGIGRELNIKVDPEEEYTGKQQFVYLMRVFIPGEFSQLCTKLAMDKSNVHKSTWSLNMANHPLIHLNIYYI